MKIQIKPTKAILAILILSISTSVFANALSIERGKNLWQQTFTGKSPFPNRSCTSCHGQDVTVAGKHIRTNKRIEPMATSTNSTRLTDPVKVEKWMLRNCKWTIGRECTAQEKVDIIAYLKSK